MLGKESSVRQQGSERLAERRRLRRRRGLIAFCILVCILMGALVWGLWQPAVRISNIAVYGPPSLGSSGGASADASFAAYAKNAMQGSYFGIIPRNSIFFFPASSIRASILADHLDIAAVSMFRNGLTGISIKTNDRAPIARWCGLAPTEGVEEYCYVFDASGYIFATAASSTQTINPFILYAPLVGETLEPLRTTVLHAERLPHAFDFARQLDTLGGSVIQVILRGDEVDGYLKSGTRIIYILGHENDAFTALVSARENLNLSDGSIEYIDLRFDGKVYLKKKE
ncbi:MAG: hypothetical protein NUV90_02115 [Candidatus Parcubacteria bacterium]|nr:hypothetical protein [Candidatus Parcubacteria bacterium]